MKILKNIINKTIFYQNILFAKKNHNNNKFFSKVSFKQKIKFQIWKISKKKSIVIYKKII